LLLTSKRTTRRREVVKAEKGPVVVSEKRATIQLRPIRGRLNKKRAPGRPYDPTLREICPAILSTSRERSSDCHHDELVRSWCIKTYFVKQLDIIQRRFRWLLENNHTFVKIQKRNTWLRPNLFCEGDILNRNQ